MIEIDQQGNRTHTTLAALNSQQSEAAPPEAPAAPDSEPAANDNGAPHIPEGEPVAAGETSEGGEWAVYADKTRVLAQGGDVYYTYEGDVPAGIAMFCKSC